MLDCQLAILENALDLKAICVIDFDTETFGQAANNGQMIAEVSSSHRAADSFRLLAQMLTGRAEAKKSKLGLFSPFIGKLMKRGQFAE